MQSARNQHSGVNRGGVASRHRNRSMYVKVAKNLINSEKTWISNCRVVMMATVSIVII